MSGGQEIDVPSRGNLRPTGEGFGSNAVGPDGKILLHTLSNNNWYWQAALINPHTGEAKAIPLNYHGDVFRPTWGPDGRISVMAAEHTATLWRFWPEEGSKSTTKDAAAGFSAGGR
ncbi:MAG: hypothetical protein JJE04_04295 [Acidobacteriia bacterium]|nr:hypothetical protein [Terriglobia bacterium]